MTLANQITIARILLIPVFVLFAVYYGRSVDQGRPQEWQRWAAVIVFLVASVTDCLDGWVARRFSQRSPLGAVLDPIADKGLLLAAIITLSLSKWTYAFPLWFPVLVIARDAVIVTGCVLLKRLSNHLEVRPSSWEDGVGSANGCNRLGNATIAALYLFRIRRGFSTRQRRRIHVRRNLTIATTRHPQCSVAPLAGLTSESPRFQSSCGPQDLDRPRSARRHA